MTKEEIITNMCMTYDHRYFLPTKEHMIATYPDMDDLSLLSCMTAFEKEFTYRMMKQLFENDIEPYMVFIEESSNKQ